MFWFKDHTGHVYGPESEEMKNKLIELDNHLGYLIDQLKTNHLFDKLNIIITSDHGMQSILNKEPIFLDKYVNSSLFDAYGTSTTLNVFLKNGRQIIE
jgi:ectonucleotide pyrophosphatase/phosphodiesterase family protein 5